MQVIATIDMEKAMDLLIWNTRRAIFHEIMDKRKVTYSALGACLALNGRDDYLVKEALTRIRRRCEIRHQWDGDEEAFGAWFQ